MTNTQPPLILTEAVNKLLKQSNLPATLTIEQCASALAMSMTSFRRKLALEEITYKLIQSKFLNELCIQALLASEIKIDLLAIKLGYSERATFERAFRKKFGITPSQFRELSLIGKQTNNQHNLTELAKNLPPMSDSCQQLLIEKDQGNIDIHKIVEIINKDPILSGRIMGLASKAIYGKTPKNIQEAISRNLGINTVLNIAVIYAMKDALQEQVEPVIINQYCQAFLLAPKLFQLIRRSISKDVKFDIALTEQVLVFGLLGIFLLSHNKADSHQLMLHSLQGIDDVESLNAHIKKSLNISIYSASSLMLSLWHIDADLVKQLHHLDKVSLARSKRKKEDDLTLFMLSCLYVSASENADYSELEQKAELLSISDFSKIKEMLTTISN